jgi:hypothetical protein
VDPTILAALLSFAPGLLSSLFGDPAKKYRHQVAQLTSAGNVGKTTNQFYQNNLASPAYSQGLRTIAAGANQSANDVGASLAARGIGTTGTGAILSGLTPSLVGSQQAGLRTSAYNSAQGQAQNAIQAQLAALGGTQGPSQTQQYFGAGLDAFLPYLQGLLHGHQAGSRSMVGGYNAMAPSLLGR